MPTDCDIKRYKLKKNFYENMFHKKCATCMRPSQNLNIIESDMMAILKILGLKLPQGLRACIKCIDMMQRIQTFRNKAKVVQEYFDNYMEQMNQVYDKKTANKKIVDEFNDKPNVNKPGPLILKVQKISDAEKKVVETAQPTNNKNAVLFTTNTGPGEPANSVGQPVKNNINHSIIDHDYAKIRYFKILPKDHIVENKAEHKYPMIIKELNRNNNSQKSGNGRFIMDSKKKSLTTTNKAFEGKPIYIIPSGNNDTSFAFQHVIVGEDKHENAFQKISSMNRLVGTVFIRNLGNTFNAETNSTKDQTKGSTENITAHVKWIGFINRDNQNLQLAPISHDFTSNNEVISNNDSDNSRVKENQNLNSGNLISHDIIEKTPTTTIVNALEQNNNGSQTNNVAITEHNLNNTEPDGRLIVRKPDANKTIQEITIERNEDESISVSRRINESIAQSTEAVNKTTGTTQKKIVQECLIKKLQDTDQLIISTNTTEIPEKNRYADVKINDDSKNTNGLQVVSDANVINEDNKQESGEKVLEQTNIIPNLQSVTNEFESVDIMNISEDSPLNELKRLDNEILNQDYFDENSNSSVEEINVQNLNFNNKAEDASQVVVSKLIVSGNESVKANHHPKQIELQDTDKNKQEKVEVNLNPVSKVDGEKLEKVATQKNAFGRERHVQKLIVNRVVSGNTIHALPPLPTLKKKPVVKNILKKMLDSRQKPFDMTAIKTTPALKPIQVNAEVQTDVNYGLQARYVQPRGKLFSFTQSILKPLVEVKNIYTENHTTASEQTARNLDNPKVDEARFVSTNATSEMLHCHDKLLGIENQQQIEDSNPNKEQENDQVINLPQIKMEKDSIENPYPVKLDSDFSSKAYVEVKIEHEEVHIKPEPIFEDDNSETRSVDLNYEPDIDYAIDSENLVNANKFTNIRGEYDNNSPEGNAFKLNNDNTLSDRDIKRENATIAPFQSTNEQVNDTNDLKPIDMEQDLLKVLYYENVVEENESQNKLRNKRNGSKRKQEGKFVESKRVKRNSTDKLANVTDLSKSEEFDNKLLQRPVILLNRLGNESGEAKTESKSLVVQKTLKINYLQETCRNRRFDLDKNDVDAIISFRKYLIDQQEFQCAKYKCLLCISTYASKRALTRHQKRIHSENTGDFQCVICECKFKMQRALNFHLIGHSRYYQCRHCSQFFTLGHNCKIFRTTTRRLRQRRNNTIQTPPEYKEIVDEIREYYKTQNTDEAELTIEGNMKTQDNKEITTSENVKPVID